MNALKHLWNIIKHKYFVYVYGRRLDIGRWQLIKHDMSKLSPIEFLESVKYFQGSRSPIPACKAANGYSKAWQHHKGRNPHHYEYWVDNIDTGMTMIPIPWKYLLEMVADWYAAGRTYNGKSFTNQDEINWWESNKDIMSLNPLTRAAVNRIIHHDCVLKKRKDRMSVIHNEKWIYETNIQMMFDEYKEYHKKYV